MDPLCLGGVAVLARMAWTVLGAAVGGCAHRFSCASARTRHHPGTIAALEGRIWLPRACDQPTESSSSVFTVRSETQVGYFVVEGLEVRQARCLAQGQGIAKHGLDAGEPPR